MCGRFTIGEIKDLITRFSVEEPVADMPHPRYNIAPTQSTPVIVGWPNRMVTMRFGLIPFWAKDEKIGPKLINARAETVSERPAFRAALKDRRCLVPTTGFYEWRRTEHGRMPYFARLKDEGLFAMAGLHDHWASPSGEEVHSFTIITTAANDLLSEVHDRMPVILTREGETTWLHPGPLDEGARDHLLRPFPSEGMESYPVSRAVNDLCQDSEGLMKPLPPSSEREWF